MTTYRLPDWLGGNPVSRIVLADSADPKVTVLVETDTTHATIGLDRDQLVEVKPPLPPEPPNGTVYSNGADAIIRCDDDNDPQGCWYTTGDKQMWRWDEIAPTVAQPGWRRYIPDPADDAPELPWKGHDDEGDTINVYRTSPTVKVAIAYESEHSSKYVLLKPEVARQAGLALLRAAREVEQP